VLQATTKPTHMEITHNGVTISKIRENKTSFFNKKKQKKRKRKNA
jgi:hypothetical protein